MIYQAHVYYHKVFNLGSMFFDVRPLWMDLISALLSLARSRHSLTFPFALGTNMKLICHSDVSSMPGGTITCCLCSLSSSSFRGPAKYILPFLGVHDAKTLCLYIFSSRSLVNAYSLFFLFVGICMY